MATIQKCAGIEPIKLRPLQNASERPREKALEEQELLKAYQPRPLTTTIVARRLVEEALGIRSTISLEQLNAVKAKIRSCRGLLHFILIFRPF